MGVPIGRMSEYSSLRKLNKIKYNIHDTTLDRRQFVPRFVIRPQNQFSYEGQSVKFTCRVVALAAPTITWYHSNLELRQSVEFMKRYAGEDYTFVSIVSSWMIEESISFVLRTLMEPLKNQSSLMYNLCLQKHLCTNQQNKWFAADSP